MTEYFPRHYRSLGKEVLLDGEHVADARSPELAALIAESLNQRPANLGAAVGVLHGVDEAADMLPGDWVAFGDDRTRSSHYCSRRQEGDEYACSCGKRWDVADGEDHP